jgi:hypothetical protein
MKYPIDEPLWKDIWIVDHFADIQGKPQQVWPWLAQMGNGRAGWYSYDWLDNLGKKSFDYIDSELVKISINQRIPFAVISEIEIDRRLSYQFGTVASMTYALEDLDGKQTRIWGRMRLNKPGFVFRTILKHGHLVMLKKQFAEIKRRVERQGSPQDSSKK